MNVSDLRKRILRALDDARKEAAVKRADVDRAAADYERFLTDIAVPLFRQAATVLRAEGHPFTANTPAGSVRLVSDHAQTEFLELELDVAGAAPQVTARTSARGRRGPVVQERPLAPGKRIADLTEDDVSSFVVAEIQKLVTRP